ncbi:MAG: Rpn family recombination-promoting nuclease/putative transposase [Chitinispirillales bacterium]|jgi:predicted transposase/invertase (TIGR01784 family)|nr:Rpn family recombination-promoting nuclease/putative transposase [Chitinispirillales bacterium]
MAATDNGEPQGQDAGDGEPNQKHDESYKSTLSNNEAIFHFLKKYIAEPWVADISAKDIKRIDKSFITKEYSHIDSDLIYKLKTGGADVYFYVLLELQSQVDFTMPYRLLRYMVELLNDIFKNTDKATRECKDFRLPAIVPVVLYNGYDNWTVVRTFREYTKDYEKFGNNTIDFQYLLFNLKQKDEHTILPVENILDAFFSIDKRRLEKRLSPKEFVEWWTEQAPHLSTDDRNTLINWVERVLYRGKISPKEMETLKESLEKGDMMTMTHGLAAWRDEIIEEATHTGVLEGRREGVLEGRREAALKTARKLKDKGMSINDIAEATDLSVDEILQL